MNFLSLRKSDQPIPRVSGQQLIVQSSHFSHKCQQFKVHSSKFKQTAQSSLPLLILSPKSNIRYERPDKTRVRHCFLAIAETSCFLSEKIRHAVLRLAQVATTDAQAAGVRG